MQTTRAVGRSWTPRERAIAWTTLGVVCGALAFRVLLMPAFRHWADLREQTRVARERLDLLEQNVAESTQLHREALVPVQGPGESDQVVMSIILRELEQAARLPGFRLRSVKPLPVETRGEIKVYRIQAAGTGDLSDLIRIVDRMTMTPGTGVDEYALRAAHGGGVEVSLTLRTIRVRTSPSRQALHQVGGAR